uniref:Secreted protein n=1 Tax=Angiostrongylus cantonensis TaxID=6313 RepID=A0A0K0D2K6_ANGCA
MFAAKSSTMKNLVLLLIVLISVNAFKIPFFGRSSSSSSSEEKQSKKGRDKVSEGLSAVTTTSFPGDVTSEGMAWEADYTEIPEELSTTADYEPIDENTAEEE